MEKGSTGSKQTKRYSWIIGLLIFYNSTSFGLCYCKEYRERKKRQQLLILHKVQ